MSLSAHTAYLKEGKEAIRASGFPFEFIQEVQAVSQHGGPVISFRSGQPPSLNKGFPVSPKPMSIKTKTCLDAQGIPFISGFIPDNQQLFGRKGAHWESDSEADVIRRRLSIGSSEREKISTIPLQVRLQEILTGIDEGQYEKIKEDEDFLYFRVNLSPEQSAVFADPLLDRTKLEFNLKKNMLSVHVPQHDSVEALVELGYRTQPEKSFVPLTVISYEDAPVTGDADFLGVAVPLRAAFQKACIVSPAMFASYNTENMKELYLLFSQYVLLKGMIEKKELDAKKIDQDTAFQKLLREHPGVQTAGIITPYELYVMLTVNAHMAELPEPLRRGRERLIRHGAENHNPGDPAALDGNMLHIINGSVLMTESEIQLRDFYLYAAVPEKYYFHVHPHWNLEIWAPLVARQIDLGLHDLMDPATIRAYLMSAALKTINFSIIDPAESGLKLSAHYRIYPQLKGGTAYSPALFGCVRVSSRAGVFMQTEEAKEDVEVKCTQHY